MDYLYFFNGVDHILDKDLYYHAFELKDLEHILKEGIKSPILMGHIFNQGFNGPFYVSLCKKLFDEKGIYDSFSHFDYPMFMIKDIKPCKTYQDKYYNLNWTSLPYRHSPYKDEYQQYLKVEPSKIIGIRLGGKSYKDRESLSFIYKTLKNNNINIPIYNYFDEDEGIIHEIDKGKCLRLLY